MIIRLGYVYKPLTLDDYISFKTTSYKSFKENPNQNKIEKIILDNLHTLKEILKYNIKNNIHFFRLSSSIIPLATLNELNLDYILPYQNEYKELSNMILENNLRIDMHPDQYTILNSARKEVIDNAIKILNYHYKILKALKIPNKEIILHIGSATFGKSLHLKKFKNTFNNLPIKVRKSIILENDDKTYNVEDTLSLCKDLDIPLVLDYHHNMTNPSKHDISYYLDDIIKTWHGKRPKMHFSSPKSNQKKEYRYHNDYINSDDFINFLEKLKPLNTDIDIMLEAKQKDLALFKLVRELKYKTNYKFIDETTFEI